ncbi:hypothetical protein B9Z55_027698 [Caenorhabditis nigoni]|uniref:Uncharacterized protein n=1 Tax=Caenorhabditis nigoni TaxID=1611254 RepID=A0A2G5SF93_9PELO|nr:hypothetical protein B9Z55_027698 [Caenorhabditis nigoni]
MCLESKNMRFRDEQEAVRTRNELEKDDCKWMRTFVPLNLITSNARKEKTLKKTIASNVSFNYTLPVFHANIDVAINLRTLLQSYSNLLAECLVKDTISTKFNDNL